MTEETNIVAVYPDHDAAEQAVSKLRDASFDVTKLSIIGKDYHTDEKVVGYYTTGERMKYWGVRGRFGVEFGDCCSDPAFSWFPASVRYWWPDLSWAPW